MAPRARSAGDACSLARRAAPATLGAAACSRGMSALADRQGSPAVDPSSSRGDGPYVAARPCVAHALRACKGPCAAQTGGHSRPHLCCLEPPYTYLCCCSKPCAVLLHGWRCKWQRLRQTAGCVTATRPDATLEPLENCPSDSPCSTSFVDIVRAVPQNSGKHSLFVCLFCILCMCLCRR